MPGGIRLVDGLPNTKLKNHAAIHTGHVAMFSDFPTQEMVGSGHPSNDLKMSAFSLLKNLFY